MEKGLTEVAVCYGHKIYYEAGLYKQYIVLWPKWNGNKELRRFDTQQQAEDFIVEEMPKSWINKYLS